MGLVEEDDGGEMSWDEWDACGRKGLGLGGSGWEWFAMGEEDFNVGSEAKATVINMVL